MENSTIVRRRQTRANLARDFYCLVRRQATDASQQRSQLFALDKFHREEKLTVDLANVVNPTDVRMRHLAGDTHFAIEALHGCGILREIPGKKFKSDRLAQPEIVRAIDFAHAAFAQQTNDAIALCENRSRHETRVVNRVERRRRGRSFAPGISYLRLS